jgi:hypothetical protein
MKTTNKAEAASRAGKGKPTPAKEEGMGAALGALIEVCSLLAQARGGFIEDIRQLALAQAALQENERKLLESIAKSVAHGDTAAAARETRAFCSYVGHGVAMMRESQGEAKGDGQT